LDAVFARLEIAGLRLFESDLRELQGLICHPEESDPYAKLFERQKTRTSKSFRERTPRK
jgi:hypothetical protein